MHEVLVNCLGGLGLPRKSVVRLTNHPNMTLDVYGGCKTTMQQQQYNSGLAKTDLNSEEVLISSGLKVADLNFGCATFCALPSFDAVTTFSSHTTSSSHKVNVKGSDIDMCSAIYFLFDQNTKYCAIYLCPHTVVDTF